MSVRKLSNVVDLVTKISFPSTFPWLSKPYVSSLEALAEIQTAVPVDGTEVVGWMQHSASANAVLCGMMQDYNSLVGRRSPPAMVVNSGDAYIPGVSLSDDFQFQSIESSEAQARGTVILMTPQGAMEMPINSSQTIILPNFLGWAVATNFESIQWLGVLVNWQELASKPVTQAVRCANINGFVSPMFFDCPGGIVQNITKVVITSDKPQTITMVGRAPYDYTAEVFSFQQNIEAGQTEITYRVVGLPRATHHILQIIPEDDTQTIIESVT